MAGLAALMAQHGVEAKVIEEVRENVPSSREARSRQGEAVLLFLESPAKFTAKICKRCGEAFGTNYRSVAYCSDPCRSKEISAQLGVKWDWLRATESERWGGEAPLIIPPKVLRRLQEFVQFFDDMPQTQSQIETHPAIQDSHDALVTQDNLLLISQSRLDISHTNLQQLPGELDLQHTLEEASPFDF